MPASLSLRVYSGVNAATESAAVTGIDLISADNALNSLPNRIAFPLAVNTKSYEKWLKLVVDVAPNTSVSNFQLWGDGVLQANTALYVGTTAVGVTPTNADSAVAIHDWTAYTSGAKFSWYAGALTTVGQKTDFAVFQLDIAPSASTGAWIQEVVNWSMDEI